jgi:hypothetical protein
MMVLTLEFLCVEPGGEKLAPVPLTVRLLVFDPLRVVGETERDEAPSRAKG